MAGPHVSASGVDTHAHNSAALAKLIEVTFAECKPENDATFIRDKYLVSALGEVSSLPNFGTTESQTLIPLYIP